MTKETSQIPQYEVAIIGAGFGGMGIAIKLQEMGIDNIVILDRASDLGGTWHINTYPGLTVDIPSLTYSYSFEPNPNWSRFYAPGAELKKYANSVADKYKLRQYMHFNTNIKHTEYDEQNHLWTIKSEKGESFTARLLVIATGYLSQPNYPNIQGLENFKGKVIHTAAWDHDYDLQNKTAAVIGTGATAVQMIPEVAKKLKQLYVHQRTPVWALPKLDGKVPRALKALYAALPLSQKAARLANSGLLEMIMVTGALHSKQLPFLNKGIEQFAKAHLYSQVKDKALRKKLLPSYTFGCKRPTFTNAFYPAMTRDNVDLITDGIDHIGADYIATVDGKQRKIDTLLLATGFKVWDKGAAPAFPIHGKNGLELGEFWNTERFQAYEGISIPHFPNLFYLPAPFSFTGLSYFSSIEGHMKHIERCVSEMKKQNATSVEVKTEANDAFLEDMRSRMSSTVFMSGNCGSSNSYYFNQHGEALFLRPTPTYVSLRSAATYPLTDYTYRK